jgi:hypothetical protein
MFLSSCSTYSYEGKEVESFEYVTIDYMGDNNSSTVIDLENGEIRRKGCYPKEDCINDYYEVIFTFDIDQIDVFLDEFGASGIFELDSEYKSLSILDGAGWSFLINYTDGTSKISNGRNFWPTEIFEDADIATMNLYGDDLFGTRSMIRFPSVNWDSYPTRNAI